MKKLKLFALGILSVAFLVVGLYACSNDETNNSQQENTEQKSNLQSREEGNTKIGKITNHESGDAVFTIDTERFKNTILEYDLVAEIESIEIDDTYLTIIGKDTEDFSLIAFQAKLIKDGNYLYFPDPETPELPITTFATHECDGNGCSSCSFVYEIKPNGKKGKITGCDCNDTGSCDHKVTDKDQSDKNKETFKSILEILKSIF